MKASELDWSNIKRFKPGEWPAGVLEHMDARIITVLSEIRDTLPAGHGMQPSGLAEAHVRHDGTSRHSTQGGARLSDATDFFMQWSTVWDAWRAVQAHPAVGGLGVYLDSITGRPFMHIDLRPDRMLWVRHKGVYTYHHRDPIKFFRVLADHGRAS